MCVSRDAEKLLENNQSSASEYLCYAFPLEKGPVWIRLQRDVLMKRVVMWWRRRANYGVAE